ncbi:MAG: GspH/FimT family pseudopilin [Candidatus Accumulibacter sp.]|jgi:type IV fimbrial biogenesis protein FimT|nr:GspH/FimT family pseudopilin [Accumulibacter sp.]
MLSFPFRSFRSFRFNLGFTLLELMIGVALMAILITLAVPNFSLWIRNMGIRGATESLVSGLQLARAEALKRNAAMHFQLTALLDASCSLNSAGPHWVVSDAAGVCADDSPDDDDDDDEDAVSHVIQSHDGTQAGGDKTVIDARANLFTFNGLGRLIAPATGGAGTVIDVYGADGEDDCVSANGGSGGKPRCLRVEISSGGSIRMCDPALSGDAQACGGTN